MQARASGVHRFSAFLLKIVGLFSPRVSASCSSLTKTVVLLRSSSGIRVLREESTSIAVIMWPPCAPLDILLLKPIKQVS
eukprot:22884_4